MDNGTKSFLVLVSAALLVLLLLFERPGYLSDPGMLGKLIGAEIVLVAVAKYREAFFPIIIGSFLWAGTAFPFREVLLEGRWIVLSIGAVVGLAIYLKDLRHHFGIFHLVAFACTLSALVSASVSQYPQEAILKALSLAGLFVYAAAGARAAAIASTPEVLFHRLLIGCELLTYVSAVAYFVFRWQFYGNPNSLGVVMGVALVPTLLWGLLTADTPMRRRRLAVGLLLAVLLLMSSFARAAIGSAAFACALLCVAVRRYRLLAKGTAAVAVFGVLVALFFPRPFEESKTDEPQPVVAVFLYKGKPASGVLGSRKSVWEKTWEVIQEHPWFGSGFGTSMINEDLTKMEYAKSHTDSWVIREHGNSYLAIVEWSGLLGVVPFAVLVAMAALNARKVFWWVRQSGDLSSPAVPAAAIVCAGLVHAAFEDWMFAVGYYMCVFFWPIAFILVDLIPRATVVYLPSAFAPMAQRPMTVAVSGE